MAIIVLTGVEVVPAAPLVGLVGVSAPLATVTVELLVAFKNWVV